MNHVFVRPLKAEDAEHFTDWAFHTKNNLLDPAALLYPTSFTVCAFKQSGPILYAPVQTPLMMESLAINPESTELEKAAALKSVAQFLVSQAYLKGVGEIYMFIGDESTAEFAKRQMFEEVPFRLFRLKLSDLEKSGE